MDQVVDSTLARPRIVTVLLATFAVMALALAAVGVYGVMAYSVAQRTQEIGVRMALGATRQNVVSMVLKRAALLTAVGLATGAAVAWPLSSLLQLQTFLFQVEATSVGIYSLAVGTLAASALLASAIPAFRAASIDPLVALRRE